MSGQPIDLNNPFNFLVTPFQVSLNGEDGETAKVKANEIQLAAFELPLADGGFRLITLAVHKCLDCQGYHGLLSVNDHVLARFDVRLSGDFCLGVPLDGPIDLT